MAGINKSDITQAQHQSQHQNQSEDEPSNPSRRNLLKSVGVVGAAAIGSTAASNLIAADSAPQGQATTAAVAREALEVLTAQEAETLEAICDCLIPSDENGPGAKEARAVHYIDRSLASHNSASRYNYMIGLNAVNDFAQQTHNQAFHQLSRDLQNTVLQAVQSNEVDGFAPSGASFFNMVRSHTINGTFCDPYYGGNQGFVGWDMLGYPGIRLGVSESDVARGADLAPNHESAYDHSTYTKMAQNMSGSPGSPANFKVAGGGDHA